MRKISRNFKILTLILLASTIFLTASSGGAKAASTTSVYFYTTFGGTVTANGTALTGGSTTSYTTGDTISFAATASSGFKFVCFEYVASTGALTSTLNPFDQTLSTTSCALEALFSPTTNTTLTPSGSGTATVSVLLTAGGNSNPGVPSGKTAGTFTNFTVGSSYTFKAIPGTNFKLLYWLTATVVGSTTTYNMYTATNPTIKLESDSVAVQGLFIPTSSTVTTPVINEFSAAVVAFLAIALVASALGAYAYTKRAKK
jgi:hypothetical protein